MWITHFYRSDRFKFKQRPYKQNITDMNTTTYDNRLEDAARVIVRQQVGSTSGTLEGMYGEAVSVRAEALQAEGMYEWVGSDLHNARYAAFFDRRVFKG